MFDRRDFLRHSAVISAAMAALRDMPLGAEEPKAAKRTSANETLRVAVIGCGGRGSSAYQPVQRQFGMRNSRTVRCRFVARQGRHESIKKKTGKQPKFVQDIRKLLEDKSIDIVSIATPNHWHALAAIWAMQAGKDVYVEKPASHKVLEGTVDGRDRPQGQTGSARSARKADRRPACSEAIALHPRRQDRQGQARLRHLLQARATASARSTARNRIPATIDYDLWCGPAHKLPLMRKRLHYDWHWIWEYGNGDLGNQGVHEMDKRAGA